VEERIVWGSRCLASVGCLYQEKIVVVVLLTTVQREREKEKDREDVGVVLC
jgi:hypothetical protein